MTFSGVRSNNSDNGSFYLTFVTTSIPLSAQRDTVVYVYRDAARIHLVGQGTVTHLGFGIEFVVIIQQNSSRLSGSVVFEATSTLSGEIKATCQTV